ncbi:hypothetical protein F4808DRAFT_461338 [Astrocystis sublimbata]|nr:hypothetical protein F4808DRAFT_461338 [Astrocystis sublimbata]
MQFTALLAVVLPLVAALPQPQASNPDLLAACESASSTYQDLCPMCLYRCADFDGDKETCYNSTFFSINGVQAQCEAQGGRNCRSQAADAVCPGK